MPQIKSNFKLRANIPNFDRDSFETIADMLNYNEDWIDNGHVSYCKEINMHFKFDSNFKNLFPPESVRLPNGKTSYTFNKDANGFGFGRWRKLVNEVDANYVSELSDDPERRKNITVSTDFGNIKKGTPLTDLEGKTVNDLFDNILFKEVNPTIHNPKVFNLKLNNNKIFPIAADHYAPISTDFDFEIDYGKVILNGEILGPDGKSLGGVDSELTEENKIKSHYAGDPVDDGYVYLEGFADGKHIPVTFSKPGKHIYKYKIELDNGKIQPINNHGLPDGEKWKKGFVFSNECVVEASYPVYILKGENYEICEDVQKWEENMHQDFELQPTREGKQIFKTPSKTTKLQLMFCEGYSDTNLSNYKESIEVIGNREYYVYEYQGAERGSVKLRAYFNGGL